MSFFRGCPGAINLREVRPDYIDCPFCGVELEIWSDEPFARCPGCGRQVTQSRGASCIDWCASARECVGSDKYEQLVNMLENLAAEAERDA
jgi:DNA-directed RNA polymerase subunit RPC12/RpoP